MDCAPDSRNARFGPTIVMRPAGGALQRWADDVRWRRKAHTLLPGYDRDPRYVPTIVMRPAGGVLQPGGASIYHYEAQRLSGPVLREGSVEYAGIELWEAPPETLEV